MSEFRIDTEIIERQGKRFVDGVLPVIKTVKNEVLQIYDSSEEIKNVAENLKFICSELEKCSREVEVLGNTLGFAVNLYKKTETDIMVGVTVERIFEDMPDQSHEKSSTWTIVKRNDIEMSEFYGVMTELYGFTEEEAIEIMKAFELFSEKTSELDKVPILSDKYQINIFFSCMAALVEDYSSASNAFKYFGNNPSQKAAVNFFNEMGMDGERLKEIVIKQHADPAEGARDFAHECAIYSVMSNENALKWLAGLDDNVNDLVGFKGDIYTNSMGNADMLADIAAVNTYNRMIHQGDGDFMKAYMEYNAAVAKGDINESLEYLNYYGNGDPVRGMFNLKLKINRISFGAIWLSEYWFHKGAHYGENEDLNETVQNTANKFLTYLSEESGVPVL